MFLFFFVFKQKTAYELRISDWSSDVCSSDLVSMNDVLIVGAGIGGLTTALYLHRLGIPCRVIEAVPEIRPLGVGINLLPHAMKELGDLGLQPALEAIAVERSEERR